MNEEINHHFICNNHLYIFTYRNIKDDKGHPPQSIVYCVVQL